MGFLSPSLNVVFDYFSHSCPKMCKICLKRTLDATFLDCLALTSCDVIGELLPEWACLTLQGGTTFLLTSKLADISVSRVRNTDLTMFVSLWRKLVYYKCLMIYNDDISHMLQGGEFGFGVNRSSLHQQHICSLCPHSNSAIFWPVMMVLLKIISHTCWGEHCTPMNRSNWVCFSCWDS